MKQHVADKILAEEARKRIIAKAFDSWRESCYHSCLAIKIETKIDMGLKTKKKKPTKKRILLVTKRCDSILPILSLLGFGSLVSSAAGVAKAINDNKTAQRQLEELKPRHRRSWSLSCSVQAQTRSRNGKN